ncbi:MAG: DMT family transporter [Microbacteriaceae bacterium]
MVRLSSAGFAATALVLASVLWGTTGTAASFFPPDVSPIAIGASTMACGGILLFLFSVLRSLRVLSDPHARRWALRGAVGVVIYPMAFYTSMDQAGVAIGNVVSLGSGPVFAALFEWVWERRPLSTRWAISTAIAVCGIVLLAFGGYGNSADAGAIQPERNIVLGVACGLIAGMSYALYTYASTRAISSQHSGRGVTGAMFGVGALVLVPVLLATGEPLLQSAESLSIAAYLALGPMFVAYVLFGFALTHVRSSVATTITLLEPVVATILAVVVVGERLALVGWAGLALILLGITVLVSARHNAKPSRSF